MLMTPATSALLLDRDPARLTELGTALRDFGFDVMTVARVADVERWPIGKLVVTDVHFFTPWWKEIGATAVVVLAQTAEQGIYACQRGATAWMLHGCAAGALVQAIEGTRLSCFP